MEIRDEVIRKLCLTMFVVVFAVVGCGDDDDDDNNNDVIHQPSADDWVGKWELDRSFMDTIVAGIIGDEDDVDGEITSHFIFANNGTFFWDMSLMISNEIAPGIALTMEMDFIFNGTYVVDGGRFSLIAESVDVEITPEDLPGVEALEKEIEADFDIATLGIGSGTWVLEGDVMTLTDDPLDEDTLILHKV